MYDVVYNFVAQMVEDEVPIDGIGMQCHFNYKFLNQSLYARILKG